MQGIYNDIPETNHLPREYSVAAILQLMFMMHIMLVPMLIELYCTFTLVLSKVRVPRPIWLFSAVPEFHAFLVFCSGIF
jgi:hypothetical protein